MRRSVMIAVAIVLGAAVQPALAQTARGTMSVGLVVLAPPARSVPAVSAASPRLPLRAGLYAPRGGTCAPGAEDVIALAADRITMSGASCSVDTVRLRGRSLRFREVCWRDGAESAVERRWTRRSISRFEAAGRTYERCRGTVTARR